jgi:hypothetical protein
MKDELVNRFSAEAGRNLPRTIQVDKDRFCLNISDRVYIESFLKGRPVAMDLISTAWLAEYINWLEKEVAQKS